MRAGAVILLTVCVLTTASAGAEEPLSLAFSGGVSNFNKSEKRIELGVEYRHPIRVWGLAVAAGLTVNDDRSAWIYGGLRRDFSVGGSWILTPA